MNKTKVVVLMGLFIALNVIFTRILKPIDLPNLRVSFGFLATSFAAILMGPVLGGISAAIADVIGYFLFPSSAQFFPGFTLSAFLAGLVYGLFLHKNPRSLLRVILAVITITLVIDLGLNTLWLSILLKKAWLVLLFPRVIKSVIMIPVHVVMIHLLWKYVGVHINRSLTVKRA